MYSGIHRAKVVSRDDPEKRGRLLVTLPVILGNPDGSTPDVWVEPCWSSFNRDLPAPGTIVLVAFEYPCNVLTNGFWLGIIDYLPNGFSETPIQAQQNPETDFPGGRGCGTASFGDLTSLHETADEDVILDANTIDEPPSFQDTTYGQDHVRKTPGGMVEEWDDGDGSFENHRYNRLVGNNQVEVRGDGTEYRRATVRLEFLLDERRVVDGDREQIVGGHERTLVEGSRIFEIDGALIGETGPVRVKLSSLDVAIDRDGEDGARLSSGGGLTVEATSKMLLMASEASAVVSESLMMSAGGVAGVRGSVGASLSSDGIAVVAGTGGVLVRRGTPALAPFQGDTEAGVTAEASAYALANYVVTTPSPTLLSQLVALVLAHTHTTVGTAILTGPPNETAAIGAGAASALAPSLTLKASLL